MSNKAKQTEVKIIEGALVASFMGAVPPSVWRVDLGRVDSASFELGSEGGKTTLYMRGAGNVRESIAAFNDTEQAQQALGAISKAIFKGGGSSCPVSSGGLGRKIVWAASIILIIFLFLMMSIGGRHRATPEGSAPSQASSSQQAPAPRAGVPLPADEVFGN